MVSPFLPISQFLIKDFSGSQFSFFVFLSFSKRRLKKRRDTVIFSCSWVHDYERLGRWRWILVNKWLSWTFRIRIFSSWIIFAFAKKKASEKHDDISFGKGGINISAFNASQHDTLIPDLEIRQIRRFAKSRQNWTWGLVTTIFLFNQLFLKLRHESWKYLCKFIFFLKIYKKKINLQNLLKNYDFYQKFSIDKNHLKFQISLKINNIMRLFTKDNHLFEVLVSAAEVFFNFSW